MNNPVREYGSTGSDATKALYYQRYERPCVTDHEIVLYVSSYQPLTSATLVVKPRLRPVLMIFSGQGNPYAQMVLDLDKQYIPFYPPALQLLSQQAQTATQSTYQYSITLTSKM